MRYLENGDIEKEITEQDLELNPELHGQVKVGETVVFGGICDENGKPLDTDDRG